MAETVTSEPAPLAWSPQVWAYIGDAVYELHVRQRLVEQGPPSKPHMLHEQVVALVRAEAQVEALQRIEKQLTEAERDVVRRGRNAASRSPGTDWAVRAYSTAFEALIGYLHLTGQEKRLREILAHALGEQFDDL